MASVATMTGAQFDALPYEEGRIHTGTSLILGQRAQYRDRFARGPQTTPIHGAPNIAAEVIAPSERAGESRRKFLTYRASGVEEVWQMYPATREVLVYAVDKRRELQQDEDLTTDLLPGSSLRVASLFE